MADTISAIELHTGSKSNILVLWFFQSFWVFLNTKNISYDQFEGAEFEILQINQ